MRTESGIAIDPMPVIVVRWLARAASLASIGLLVAFATSGGGATRQDPSGKVP